MGRELPGDRAMFSEPAPKDDLNENNDMDLELRPYFPEVDEDVTTASAGLSQHYIEYMNELFNLALQILVQSLEVVACFPELHSNAGGKQLLATPSPSADGKNLHQMLL